MTENKTPTPGPFSRTHVAVCCILAAGTMWGCQGLPSRALAGLGMPALPIMVLRDLGGAALLGIVAFGEPLTLGVALGLVCVLGAVVLLK